MRSRLSQVAATFFHLNAARDAARRAVRAVLLCHRDRIPRRRLRRGDHGENAQATGGAEHGVWTSLAEGEPNLTRSRAVSSFEPCHSSAGFKFDDSSIRPRVRARSRPRSWGEEPARFFFFLGRDGMGLEKVSGARREVSARFIASYELALGRPRRPACAARRPACSSCRGWPARRDAPSGQPA